MESDKINLAILAKEGHVQFTIYSEITVIIYFITEDKMQEGSSGYLKFWHQE